MNNILYLCLGGGNFVLQARFSIFSAFRHRPGDQREVAFHVYTDTPEKFEDLPVHVERIDQKTIDRWLAGQGYVPRAKIALLEEALRQLDGPCILVDTDTYFTRWPGVLFDRIGPGRSIMHVREGLLRNWGLIELARFVEEHPVQTVDGKTWTLSSEEVTWNSGVVGLHPADQALCHDALALSDHFWQKTRVWIAEQYALSVVLSRKTKRREAVDVVNHYLMTILKDAFDRMLPAIMETTATLPLEQRARELWKYRPVLPLSLRVKYYAKMYAKRMGLKRGLSRR